jgi:hypothetical protein
MGGDRSQPPSLLGAVNPVGPGIHGSSSSSGSSTGNTVSLRQQRRWYLQMACVYLNAIKSFVFKGIIKSSFVLFYFIFLFSLFLLFFLRFAPRKQRRGFSDSSERSVERWARRGRPAFESSSGWHVWIETVFSNGHDKSMPDERVLCRRNVIDHFLGVSRCFGEA